MPPRSSVDPNLLFSCTIQVMWWLYAMADEQDASSVRDDVLVAINELEMGPWRHLPGVPPTVDLPFTVVCVLLDTMLDELDRVTPGLGARVALVRTRRRLNGTCPTP